MNTVKEKLSPTPYNFEMGRPLQKPLRETILNTQNSDIQKIMFSIDRSTSCLDK